MSKARYSIAGLTIESEVPLCIPASNSQESLDFDLSISKTAYSELSGLKRAFAEEECQEILGEGSQPWLTISVNSSSLIADILDLAYCYFEADSGELRLGFGDEVDEDILAHITSAIFLPVILAYLNMFVLHASAVKKQGEAVVFLGPSGSGKSSAAYFAKRFGYQVLADDFVVLAKKESRFGVWGSGASIRLRDDIVDIYPELSTMASKRILSKQSYLEGNSSAEFSGLKKIIFLSGNSPKLQRPTDIFSALIEQEFFGLRLGSSDKSQKFLFLSELIKEVEFLSIDPRQEQVLAAALDG